MTLLHAQSLAPDLLCGFLYASSGVVFFGFLFFFARIFPRPAPVQQSVRPASSARSSAAGEDDLVSPLHMGQRFFKKPFVAAQQNQGFLYIFTFLRYSSTIWTKVCLVLCVWKTVRIQGNARVPG